MNDFITVDDVKASDPLALYLKQISEFPLLTIQEEQTIGEKMVSLHSRLNDLEEERITMTESDYDRKKCTLKNALLSYKNKMIYSNLRMVVPIAKKYRNRGLDLLDLIDNGNIGLIEAVNQFDYTKDRRFSTYVTWWIKQAIIKSIGNLKMANVEE
jgi:RNA polymerase primary sigma factor